VKSGHEMQAVIDRAMEHLDAAKVSAAQ